MRNTIKYALLTGGVFFLLGFVSLLIFPSGPFKPPIIRDLAGANGLHVDIKSVMPGELPSLPNTLLDAIADNLHSYTDITHAIHLGTIGLTPEDIPVHDTWCILVNPPAHITLHYLLHNSPDLYGLQQTSLVDHFLILKRDTKWVLYDNEYYCPSKLGS